MKILSLLCCSNGVLLQDSHSDTGKSVQGRRLSSKVISKAATKLQLKSLLVPMPLSMYSEVRLKVKGLAKLSQNRSRAEIKCKKGRSR